MFLTLFGPKLLILLVMLQIGYILIGRKPNISYFRVFGCKCYILKKGSRLSKFEKKCDDGFLLGYSSNSKAYRVYNKTHGIVEGVYDVEFDETNGSQEESDNLNDVRGEELIKAMKAMAIGDVKPKEVEDDDTIMVIPSTSTTIVQDDQDQQDAQVDNIQDHSPPSPLDIPSTSAHDSHTHPRIHHTVSKDHHVDQIIGDISKGVQTRSRIALFCEHCSFASCIKPNHVDEALQDPKWMNAMHEELNNFTQNEELVERPKNYNVIGTKWVFHNKHDEKGIVHKGIYKLKDWILVKLFHQLLDWKPFGFFLYLPVLTISSYFKLDVKSAFLNGKISELVYVEQSPGFEDPKKPDHVYKLSKALYGLKQAPQAWYERLRDFLVSKGFKIGKVDTSFVKSMWMTLSLVPLMPHFVRSSVR
ncbi:LOW QUALITY PROTEIN: hypothetical protein U9M48_040127 [Paspalum notatum var. saurae]|uniref:Reverse transcriptase Ty1/copia-type domain-containing protein n=1 Tax=Paspalum notatum var. saurae TaxID=547442 RepID=A0AAQ3XC26_PASNO